MIIAIFFNNKFYKLKIKKIYNYTDDKNQFIVTILWLLIYNL